MITSLGPVRLAWRGDPPLGLFPRANGSRNCAGCGAPSQVTRSTVLDTGNILRSRKCPACGAEYRTLEVCIASARKVEEE